MVNNKPENQVLETDPIELQKVATLRKFLEGTDRDDHIEQVDRWEKEIKEKLIAVSLQKHEGIEMLIKKSIIEIKSINQILVAEADPKPATPAEFEADCHRRALLYEKRNLWSWFLNFFTDAKERLEVINKELDMQLDSESSPQEEI